MTGFETVEQSEIRSAELCPSRRHASGKSLAYVLVSLMLAVVTYGIPITLSQYVDSMIVLAVSVCLVTVPTVMLVTSDLAAYLFYWMTLVLTQNVMSGLWLTGLGVSTVPVFVTEAKTLSVAVAVVVSSRSIVMYLRDNRQIAKCFIVYCLTILASVRGISESAVAYGRNFLMPAVFMILIASLSDGRKESERIDILRNLFVYTAALLATGSVVEIALGTDAWRSLLNLYSLEALAALSEVTNVLGVVLPRVGGILGEPTTAGYIAAIVVLATSVNPAFSHDKDVVRKLCILLSIGVLIAAAAKNGAILITGALVALALARLGAGARLIFAGVASWSLLLTLTYLALAKGPRSILKAFTDPLSIVGGESLTFHVAGLVSGVSQGLRSVIGEGLGRGGNFSRISGDAPTNVEWLGTGGESAWGVLAYQAGALGLISFIVLFGVAGAKWGRASTAFLSAWVASAMFAEALFGPAVAGTLVIAAALSRTGGTSSSLTSFVSRNGAEPTVGNHVTNPLGRTT